MSDSRARRGWVKPAVAALLLMIQALGSPAVALAHAREPGATLVAVEAGHTDHCPVLHNELTCTLCQYAGSLVVTRQAQPQPDLGRVALVAVVVVSTPRAVARPAPSTSPRAPPAPLA